MDAYSMPTESSSGCSLNSGDFWMVWNVHGRSPTYAHASEDAANTEAERLARQNPGQTFVVLRALHGFIIKPPEPPPVTKISLSEIDHMPF